MAKYWYDHVHLFSPEPIKTAEFYETMFNARNMGIHHIPQGNDTLELRLNEARVLIADTHGPDHSYTVGLDHWGIRTDDISSTVAQLKTKGINFREEIREIRPGVKIAFFWAPDNVLIELIENRNVSEGDSR